MSRVAQLLVLVICAASCFPSFAQGCKNSVERAWNDSLYYVDSDCPAEFRSANKRLVLRFASDGRISIKGKIIVLKGRRVEPPAMFSWSPKSNAFFINDGEGSGMSSMFRLFRIKGSGVYEDKAVERAATALYRRRKLCASSAYDPNVYGFGWDNQGSKIYLLVQATVHEPCGRQDEFISLVVRTSDGKILETLSKEETKQRFSTVLPPSLFRE